MKSLSIVLLALCALCPGTHARAQAQASMEQMAGVYKERVRSGFIVPGKPDEHYDTENVVEIVPFDTGHLYVRAHLEFYNGHTCDIAGMARFENGAFVYHDPERLAPNAPPCALKVGVAKGRLRLTDRATPEAESSCSAYCGARGSLTYDIGMDRRRTIRYLDRLKASHQYAKAIDDLRQTEPHASLR